MNKEDFNEMMHILYNPKQGSEIRIEGEDYMYDEDELDGIGGWINITVLEDIVNEVGMVLGELVVFTKDYMIELGYKQIKNGKT